MSNLKSIEEGKSVCAVYFSNDITCILGFGSKYGLQPFIIRKSDLKKILENKECFAEISIRHRLNSQIEIIIISGSLRLLSKTLCEITKFKPSDIEEVALHDTQLPGVIDSVSSPVVEEYKKNCCNFLENEKINAELRQVMKQIMNPSI
jgi:hypothetical protein